MGVTIRTMLLLVALTTPIDAAAQAPAPGFFTALRDADRRVATILYRLTTRNVALCRDRQPQLGWALHALDQYDGEARTAANSFFGFSGAVAIEAVVPGGPAARAGVSEGDSIGAIGEAVFPDKSALPDQTGTATRRAAEQRIGALPADAPIVLKLRAPGGDRRVIVVPTPACRSDIELILGEGWDADADGSLIRISSRYLEIFDDADVAVIVAHELAHNILRHRARLDAAGVSRGVLAEVGRNGRLFRASEDEADRLSVYLLYNAGYDPASASAFWRTRGDRIDGGLFRSRTHRGAKSRADAMERETALIRAGAKTPILPEMLALRDAPLS